MKIGHPLADAARSAVLLGVMLGGVAQMCAAVFMGDGIKIGDVTQTSAILWTRLTQHPELKRDGFAFPSDLKRKNEPTEAEQLQGHALAEMEGAMPGAAGEVRFLYWADGEQSAQAKSTAWMPVAATKDFTARAPLSGLRAATRYRFRAEGRSKADGAAECVTEGSFATPPAADTVKPITFTTVTCQDYWKRDDPVNGHRVYDLMRKLNPDFFVHTGDMEYYDRAKPFATTVALARFKWDRIYALPFERAFQSTGVASYFIKDDHDTLKDDCWPGQHYGELTWSDGLALVREQVPVGDNPSRHIRWGKDLEIWLPEGREYRSANNTPDGPEKTIWGRAQKQWFFDTMRASDATFRIVFSPTPVVGPDRVKKNDNLSNAGFETEGREMREFMAAQKNTIVICGDRHWQYFSIDPATGLREYGSGPTSDAHAEGFSESDREPMQHYLKIVGGFLAVTIERVDGKPRAVFRHYGTNGQINNEDVVVAK